MNLILFLFRIFLFYYLIKILFRVFLFFLLSSRAARQKKSKQAQSKENIIDAEYKEL